MASAYDKGGRHEQQAGEHEDGPGESESVQRDHAQGVVDRRADVAVGRAEQRRDAQHLVEVALSLLASRHYSLTPLPGKASSTARPQRSPTADPHVAALCVDPAQDGQQEQQGSGEQLHRHGPDATRRPPLTTSAAPTEGEHDRPGFDVLSSYRRPRRETRQSRYDSTSQGSAATRLGEPPPSAGKKRPGGACGCQPQAPPGAGRSAR